VCFAKWRPILYSRSSAVSIPKGGGTGKHNFRRLVHTSFRSSDRNRKRTSLSTASSRTTMTLRPAATRRSILPAAACDDGGHIRLVQGETRAASATLKSFVFGAI